MEFGQAKEAVSYLYYTNNDVIGINFSIVLEAWYEIEVNVEKKFVLRHPS